MNLHHYLPLQLRERRHHRPLPPQNPPTHFPSRFPPPRLRVRGRDQGYASHEREHLNLENEGSAAWDSVCA